MTPENRKLNAERLLSDETLRTALDMIKQDAVGVFTYPTSSDEEILEARRMVRALDEFEARLRSFILDGKMAERRN